MQALDGVKGKAQLKAVDLNMQQPTHPPLEINKGCRYSLSRLRTSHGLASVCKCPLNVFCDNTLLIPGNGLVVHHSATLGLVVVDRNTVPVGPADVNLSFGAHPAELAAHVVFLHPLHNFAVRMHA